ncbi:BPSS1780 family membrane protein [Neisseria sp. 23W00296]|uniref:BPSS1780 family membrane protein n=1 Tax=unclassified Neisseria TaxID=2623750 RepID=UPI00375787E4
MNPYEPSSQTPETPFSPPPAKQPPLLLAEPRKVAWGEGAAWISQAWRIFRLRPWMWLGMMFVMGLISMLVQLVPFIGGLIGALIPFFFTGGLMLSCDALEEGGELQFDYLFSGFKYKFGELAVLTLLYIAFIIVGLIVVGILFAIFVGGFNPGEFAAAINSGSGDAGDALLVILFMLIIMMLYIPLVMMVWFAPALIVLHDVRPFESMKMSFKACLRNIGAFIVNALVWSGMALAAALAVVLVGLPFGLLSNSAEPAYFVVGLMTLLMIPLWLVFACMMQIGYYTAYRSIWTDPPLKR